MINFLLNILAWIGIILGSIVLVIFTLILILIIWAAIDCIIHIFRD